LPHTAPGAHANCEAFRLANYDKLIHK
jgi:hypothetical protein